MGIKKTDYQSISDYLVYEDRTEVKHEYEKGRILAMTGGSINHGMLCGNIYNSLRSGSYIEVPKTTLILTNHATNAI
jgi:hypothetical protein